jgi:DNA-binding NtrC family response regulator
MVAKTVLVVEDDPCIRIVAEEMFAAAGIEVESVQRADHALAIVAQRSEQTAFLFTDVRTPGPIDGIDLARLVKTHWPHVEVLVTSARPVSNIVLPDGVRFTAKPWSGKDVLKLARAAVAEQ